MLNLNILISSFVITDDDVYSFKAKEFTHEKNGESYAFNDRWFATHVFYKTT